MRKLKSLFLLVAAVYLGHLLAPLVTSWAQSLPGKPLMGYADLLAMGGIAPGTRGTGYTNDAVNLPAGQTINLLPLVSGSGIVDHLWMGDGSYDLEIKVYVDGESSPSIDTSLPNLTGGFFTSFGTTAFSNDWITSNGGPVPHQGGAFNLPIPFGTSIRITVTNNNVSSAYTIWSDVEYRTGLPNVWPNCQKLFVVANENDFATPNTVFTLVDVTPNKKVRLAGLVWGLDGANASTPTAPMEGNFKFYLDGASTPTMETSGAEDLFGMEGYFGGFTAPVLSGNIMLTVKTSQVWSAARFWIRDPVVGNSALKVTWNVGDTSEHSWTGTAKVQTVLYYYREI